MSTFQDNRVSSEGLGPRVSALPFFETIRSAAGDSTYLVGGTLRDLLMERDPVDLDFAVDGPLDLVLDALDGEVTRHEQFETASVRCPDGTLIDLARTRTESYRQPGALPDVEPASIELDLERRDFTINAMAVPLSDPSQLIDPHGGFGDLNQGLIRTLHPRSFSDDPTRALRAARYAARLDLELEEETRSQLAGLDLSSVSGDRLRSEILLNAREEVLSGALGKAVDWHLLTVPKDAPNLLAEIRAVCVVEAWEEFLSSVGCEGARVLADAVAWGPRAESLTVERARPLSEMTPASGSEAAAAARHGSPSELVIARAIGAEWLDDWCTRLRGVSLEIGGDDLIAEGVAAGPLVGIGLAAALSAKLDGEVEGRSEELDLALSACRAVAEEPG